jgi:hypothetical protein
LTNAFVFCPTFGRHASFSPRDLPPHITDVQRPAAFIVTLVAQPGVDGVKALRAFLKVSLRRFGLRAVDVREFHDDEPQPPGRTAMDNDRDDPIRS